MTNQSPIETGLKQRCPNCGEGRIWSSYLTFKPKCEVCGQDFQSSDTADGPAFFVGFIVLILFAPFGFIIPMAEQPLWWKLAMFAGLTTITVLACLAFLPIAKSLLLSLQVAHKAKEAELVEKDD